MTSYEECWDALLEAALRRAPHAAEIMEYFEEEDTLWSTLEEHPECAQIYAEMYLDDVEEERADLYFQKMCERTDLYDQIHYLYAICEDEELDFPKYLQMHKQ
jgi:hypothetical protein